MRSAHGLSKSGRACSLSRFKPELVVLPYDKTATLAYQ